MKVNEFARRRELSGESGGDREGDVGLGEEGGLYAFHFQTCFQI